MAIVVESQVEALYPYSYDAADGRRIAFDAGENFTLLCKANDDWWHVRRNNDEKPMYVPASYVRELDIEEQNSSKGKHEDKLVLRTSRDLSDIGGDNRNSFHEDSNSVFKDSESSKSEECVNPTQKPKTLSPGTRSLAKTLQNSGIPLRGSVSSSRGNERPKSQSLPVGWVATTDEDSGRPYYYNAKTNETSWKPPRASRSVTSHEDNVPLGWHIRCTESSDELNYYNDENDDIWGKSMDENGKVYFYKVNGTETAWELPETNTHHRTESCQSEDSLSSETEESWPPPPEEFSSMIQAQTMEKQGQLNRKKIADSGNKKIKRPSWSSTFVVLFSSNLVFYKDQKAALKKPDLQLGKPESSCELRGATLEWAPSSITRKKNAFQICAVSGLQLILQTDNQGVGQDWFNAIASIIKRLNEEDSSVVGTVQGKAGRCSASSYDSDEDDNTATTSPTVTLSPGGIIRSLSKKRAVLDDNKSNIKDKLLKLITRRPPIEELEKKGILIEQTFGCPIQHLCDREKTTVPKFVTSCIQAIENRGLSFDGLYRVCGNVSLVQRIRISVDQEDPIQLGVGPFEDVHALTGSLKLYFRELPEPLIPFDFFSGFVEAIKQNTRSSKLGALKGLVGQLPKINYETLKQLLGHLTKVMNERESNRMHAQNLAIVWGPNMMRPRYEAANMAMNMVYQNQIIEFLLLEYKEIFK